MQYTIHKALSMIKTTKARIDKELRDDSVPWILVARGQEDNVRGVPIKKIQSEIQSHYDRITSLIENYIKLKSAVIGSNAGVRGDVELHRVPVAGRNLTVAEIIEMRDVVYGKDRDDGFKSALLSKMKQDYAAAQKNFEIMQNKADEEINRYLQTITGRKKEDDSSEDKTKSIIDATCAMLHEQKDPRLIDPLKIMDKIKALENEIEEFRAESDAVLSEQNALTVIELNLTEIK